MLFIYNAFKFLFGTSFDILSEIISTMSVFDAFKHIYGPIIIVVILLILAKGIGNLFITMLHLAFSTILIVRVVTFIYSAYLYLYQNTLNSSVYKIFSYLGILVCLYLSIISFVGLSKYLGSKKSEQLLKTQ